MTQIKPVYVLIGSLLVALGGWGATFSSWAEVAQVGNFFGLCGIAGGVLLAWLGASPLKGNRS